MAAALLLGPHKAQFYLNKKCIWFVCTVRASVSVDDNEQKAANHCLLNISRIVITLHAVYETDHQKPWSNT